MCLKKYSIISIFPNRFFLFVYLLVLAISLWLTEAFLPFIIPNLWYPLAPLIVELYFSVAGSYPGGIVGSHLTNLILIMPTSEDVTMLFTPFATEEFYGLNRYRGIFLR